MYHLYLFLNSSSLCTILLGICAVLGDVLVFNSNLKHLYQAIFDNATHCIIGGLSWLIISLHLKNKNIAYYLYEIIVCAFVSSLIDIDHFIMARSLNLKDATNLTRRPFLHCSTIPVIMTIVLILTKYIGSHIFYDLTWILLTAFISHHTRDATRRGYWFFPFGSTAPIPYMMYIIITLCLPYFISYNMRLFPVSSNTAIKLQTEIIIVGATSLGLFVVLFGITIYLVVQVIRLKKKNNADDDAESTSDDQSFTQQNPNIYDNQRSYEPSPTVYQNPYNPGETFSIKRAKLINSLRNKIEHPPKDTSQDYGNAISDTHFGQNEDDYPHPKHGTLKNGILEARTKLGKHKAPIPTPHEWAQNRPRSNEYPPKDYPGFSPTKPSQLYNRQPYSPSSRSVDNYPIHSKRPELQRGLSKQENDVMTQYDQTIEGFNHVSRPQPGFLYGNRNKY